MLGPTLGTLYDELAVIAESGIAPDSIPSASSHSPVKNKKKILIITKKITDRIYAEFHIFYESQYAYNA